jgi:replicative superfamily II helicase
MKAFIRDVLLAGKRGNFAIVVPTKALINQFSIDLNTELFDVLEQKGYKVLANAVISDMHISEEKNFIFVLTPERLLRYLSVADNPVIHYLFIDEAHKLTAENDYRSITLYLAVEKTLRKYPRVKLYFASPNVSNPEIFLELFNKNTKKSYKTKESPVSQNLFFIDLLVKQVNYYTDFETYTFQPAVVRKCKTALELIWKLGEKQSNIVYCNSVPDTVANARTFCDYFSNNKPQFSPADLNELTKVKEMIRKLIHKEYYLIECLDYGVGYHFGSLPQQIRSSVEMLFKKGIIKHLFCTSTLLEGVNLPAKNVFILKNKKGKANISKIDFWNLAGRAGRLNHELAGNIFCVRDDPKDWKKTEVLENKEEIKLKTSVALKMEKKIKEIEAILNNKKLTKGSEVEKEILRYISNIISIDTLELSNGYQSPLIEKLIQENKFEIIELAKQAMENNKVPHDIILVNQSILAERQNKAYTYITENVFVTYPEQVTYAGMLEFLELFHSLYQWEESEPKLKSKESLKYYAQLANSWINGFSLHHLISSSLDYKDEHHKDILYYRMGMRIIEPFDIKNQYHVNHEINGLIGDIESVLRFTLEKYFNHYYQLLVKVLGEEKAGVNWGDFLEYGSQNSIVIALQNLGFSRHVANYLYKHHLESIIIKKGSFHGIDRDMLWKTLDSDAIEFDEIFTLLALQFQ